MEKSDLKKTQSHYFTFYKESTLKPRIFERKKYLPFFLSKKNLQKWRGDIFFSFKYPLFQNKLFSKGKVVFLGFLQIWFFHIFSSWVGWYLLEQIKDEKGVIWQKKPPNLPLCKWDGLGEGDSLRVRYWHVLFVNKLYEIGH